MKPVVIGGVLAIVAAASIVQAQTRADLYDKKSNRTGGVIVDERSGRIDVYDRDANRVGYGQLDRSTGRVDLFKPDGTRAGSAILTPSGNLRERSR